MAYSYLRSLLRDARMTLVDAAELGLASGSSMEQALRDLEARFAAAGLDRGALLLGLLADELARCRVDPRWTAEQAAGHYAALWRYCGVCLRRLEYLEARASLVEK